MSRRTKARYPRDRGVVQPARRVRGPKPDLHVRRSPLFGDIPLVPRSVTGPDGKVWSGWTFDPDYQPPLPAGAVRGDIRKQLYCEMCDVPKYFYVDEERTCAQCGREFAFLAAEQKYWYETLQFNSNSVPIRCVACRRQRRSELALQEQIGRARAAIQKHPDDPAARLALARAVVEYHERTGRGSVDAAVGAARTAGQLWPESREAQFWEGAAQARAGRSGKARAALEDFLARARGRERGLVQRARDYLAALPQ